MSVKLKVVDDSRGAREAHIIAKPWRLLFPSVSGRLALSVPIVSEGASLATPGNNPAEGFASCPEPPGSTPLWYG